jgi:hypothetical protein
VTAARARSLGERGDAQRSDEEALIDYVLWTYGELIFGRLRSALRHDSRFVVLQGRWFLRSLAVRPTQDRLVDLTQRLLMEVERPLSTAEVIPLLTGPPFQDDAQLYGLSLALEERPDLFTNIGRGGRGQWVLSCPPEGHYTARLAAYDPETGEVLCEPGEVLSRETVERLWSLDLLRIVIARQTGIGNS